MHALNIREGKIFRSLSRYPTLWAALAMVLAIFINSLLAGELGSIGPDSDDVMRLVQLRDFLGLTNGVGQNWFDTHQYRLGLEGGSNMHWSRIPDIPLIILTKIFDLFTETETALRWAYTVWPPLSSLIFIFAIAKGAQFWAILNKPQNYEFNKDKTYFFVLVLLAFFVFDFYRFAPGAIDHHNIQMGLMAVAITAALDPKSRFLIFALSGFATAISVAVGVEVYIFAAIICAFIALNWLIKGKDVQSATQGFGLGLSLGLILAFLGTIPSSKYTLVFCDSLSLITLCAGVIGGIGLTLSSRFVSYFSIKVRLVTLLCLAAVCFCVLLYQAPQCLSNPLNALPEDVTQLWLNQIKEARPLSLSMKNAYFEIPFMIGAPLVALFILCRHFYISRKWSAHTLILMLLVGSLALTFYQLRFYPFAHMVAIIPLAGFISRAYQKGVSEGKAHKNSDKKPSNILYIGALVLALPQMWATPGLLASSEENISSSSKKEGCYSSNVMTALNTLPTGVISATSNGGSYILKSTQHRALSGNYHRNIAGISLQIKIATSDPDTAVNLLRKNNIDYIHFCSPSGETERLIKENPNGLYGVLKEGNIPSGLDPILSETEDEVDVSVYRVVK